jgi:hypothetical protein
MGRRNVRGQPEFCNAQFTHLRNPKRCPELCRVLEAVCAQPLNCDEPDAMRHSYCNHTHLWALEWRAERHAWKDLKYRIAFVDEIFAPMARTFEGLPPYRAGGYRMYLYQDLATTVSVGQLRKRIEQMGLDRKVNDVRKPFKRRPARSRSEPHTEMNVSIYEKCLPPGSLARVRLASRHRIDARMHCGRQLLTGLV